MDDRARRWLRAIEDGLRARATDLLPVVLSRVSPEYVVVSCGLHGLVNEVGGEPWKVLVECWSEDAHTKCDVVVAEHVGDMRYHFEFKALWPNGAGECIRGLLKDKEKLKAVRNAWIVAFAYALDAAPPEASVRVRVRPKDKNLDWTIAAAEKKLGEPFYMSPDPPITINGYQAKGDARLVAWRAGLV